MPEISAKLIAAGLIPEGRTCGADFLALLKTQQGRYAKAIKDTGIKEKKVSCRSGRAQTA